MSELALPTAFAQIEMPGVELTPVSLTVTDPDLSFETWERLVISAQSLHSAAKFWIGDLVVFAEAAFGESYAQFATPLGKKPETIENWASVCRRVPRARRRDALSFSHHAEVARLEAHEQTEWLEAAEANEWSVDLLRQKVREAIPPKPRGSQPQWSDQQELEPGPLSLEKVEEIEERAKKVEESTLPATHPLWETQARGLARDTRTLAAAAKPTLREAASKVVESAVYRDEQVVVAFEAFEDLRALVEEED